MWGGTNDRVSNSFGAWWNTVEICTVSRVLRRFQDEGMVVVERRELEIRDEPRLHALARSVLRD